MKAKHGLFLALQMMAGLTCAMPIQADGLAEGVTPNFSREIPNAPGKSLTAVVVTYRPGGDSPPHHHAGSAFIYAYETEPASLLAVFVVDTNDKLLTTPDK